MYETAIDRSANAPRASLPLTPARRVALALGVPLCLVLIASTGFNLVANIGRGTIPVNYAIPVSAGRLAVSLNGGDIQLRQADRGQQGTLTGTGTYSLVRPHVTEELSAPGVASFGYGCPIPFGDCGLNATVKVPASTAVSVSTDGGNVTADGINGPVTLTTGGGDVTANEVAGNLTLHTDGGDIQANGVTAAQVSASTSGGDITIVFTAVPTSVQVSTDGGDVTIIVPNGNTVYDATAHTDGGSTNVTVPTDLHSSNVITATSGGGDITIRNAS
jgi:hypothetical protein